MTTKLVQRCKVCGMEFTDLTPAGTIPGHSDQWKTCAGSYKEVSVPTIKRYSHAFTIAFEVNSNDPNGATRDELLDALEERLRSLKRNGDEILEATGAPFDTYDREDV